MATRANGIPDDPAIRVLSRSKKAAARAIPLQVALGAGDLEHDRVALAATRADRGDAEPAAAAAELMHQGADDSRPGGAYRMSERDRAAVDVDLLLVDTQHPHRVECDRG